MREPVVGDIYSRRVKFGDAYDLIRIVGLVDFAGERPNEYTLQPANDFGATIQSDAAGILDHCDLISSGDPDDEWSE
jgi:hypothetical protein